MTANAEEEGGDDPLSTRSRRGNAAINLGDASALREEYARKSDELLDYVAFLEASIERLKADALSQRSRYDTEKHLIRHQIDVAVAKVHEAHRQINTHLAARHESEHKLQDALCRLQEEESRSKELETKILVLETRVLELEEDKRRDKERKDQKAQRAEPTFTDAQNESLRKKATLAWMLGCLSDAYLQSEVSDHTKTASLLKLVRKLQRELEHENLSLTHGGTASTSMIGCRYIENEMRRLLELSDTPTFENKEANASVPLVLPQLSTSRSLKQEDFLAGGKGKSRRKEQEQSRIKSPPRSPDRTPRK